MEEVHVQIQTQIFFLRAFPSVYGTYSMRRSRILPARGKIIQNSIENITFSMLWQDMRSDKRNRSRSTQCSIRIKEKPLKQSAWRNRLYSSSSSVVGPPNPTPPHTSHHTERSGTSESLCINFTELSVTSHGPLAR